MQSSGGNTGTRGCVSCGRAISWDANVCPYCGHDYRLLMAGQQQGGERKFHGSLLVLVLLIIFCWPAAIIYFFYKRD